MKQKGWKGLLLAALLALCLGACGQKESGGESSSQASMEAPSAAESGEGSDAAGPEESGPAEEEPAESGQAQNDGYEKFSQVEMGMTESQVQEILGEPTRIDKAYYYYNIMVNGQELEVTVWINLTSGLVTYKSGDFYKEGYRDAFADSATDFSAVDGLDSGELDTYEACAAAFKTPGYLIGLDESGEQRYLWVDSNDGNLSVSFRPDGTVKSYSGYC